MTELTPGTREWAEDMLRRGYQVRHVTWSKDGWISMHADLTVIDDKGSVDPWRAFGWPDGWSLYEPATAQEPAGYAPNVGEREPQGPVDLAAQVAELRARVDALERKHETRPTFVTGQAKVDLSTPAFVTSRKPAPVVMTEFNRRQGNDAEIISSVRAHWDVGLADYEIALWEVMDATRTSDRAEREAMWNALATMLAGDTRTAQGTFIERHRAILAIIEAFARELP